MWNLKSDYLDHLTEEFYDQQAPVPVVAPELMVYNEALAAELGLSMDSIGAQEVAEILSGNAVVPDSKPIAQAYAGHQFGHFTVLGDGRAVLLGEQLTPDGQLKDIQLKGGGQTKYSRRGDGRATVKSMLREYVMSEAMHHLGIPTTRSLAVVKTGLPVYREEEYEGAVLTRVAESHLRVGTFEYASFVAKQSQVLLDYAIDRHYPTLKNSESKALDFFESVMDRQIDLMVQWMRVGFVHGVMNTDNVSIAGETIDYGPCAFMNRYKAGTVFSSIDRDGRYAYANQPPIAHWNLSILASAIVSLFDEDHKTAIQKAQDLLSTFPARYKPKYFNMMCDKLGVIDRDAIQIEFIQTVLNLLEKHQIDFTNFFIELRFDEVKDKVLLEDTVYQNWLSKWKEFIQTTEQESFQLMDRTNPVLIARNHLVEQALEEAAQGSMDSFNELVNALQSPYIKGSNVFPALQEVPDGFDHSYRTFCGT